MTYILLIISLHGETYAVVPFKSAMECGRALPAVGAAVQSIDAEAIVQCKDSGIATMRPIARPEGLGQ